jgi:glutaredoxin-related protein
MTRHILDQANLHPAIRARVAQNQIDIVTEVQNAVETRAIVVVGMRQNPHPRKALRLLDSVGAHYTYLEYGSYFSEWKRRLALKMWTGWPTFPMVFIDGTLIGGAAELQALIEQGQFARQTA